MSDPFLQRLRAIFADEAREHLAHIDAGLVALEKGAPGGHAAELGALLKTLHTLKGAARSVDLGELERLCHALEGVCGAAAAGAEPGAADLDLLHRAAGVARQLVEAPSGRARNQATQLQAQLDHLAGRLEARARDGAAAAPADEPAPAPLQAEEQQAASSQDEHEAAGAAPALLRVGAQQLDAIRAEAEALLGAELALRHQLAGLRALAEDMADSGRAGAASDTGHALRCAQLAQGFELACATLGATRARLMDAILDTALVPFAHALEELPALVRNLARSRGVQVRLVMSGEGVLVDRRVVGILREALVHLVNNAVDHGIEPPAARRAAGKPEQGTLSLSVHQRERRQLLVRVADDGAGIDPAAVAAAALRGGVLGADDLERMGERQRLELALRPGVSTREQVTAVSGRGMGLAIVADKVAAVGGELAIESSPGQGSAFELLLPVSLASVRALVVQAGGKRYAVPLAALERVRKLAAGDIATVGNRETVVEDGAVLPLVRLAALFDGAAASAGGVLLLMRAVGRSYALLVDAIVAEQDVLPKSLGRLLKRVRYLSGAAQLGDGALVLVVAPDDIGAHALASAAPELAAGEAAPGTAARRVLVAEDSITSRLLLKHILEGAGCEVETAADGLEALSKLRTARFDAVVSDVEMPQMDGLALTARIRANPDTAELPVILVTSLQKPEERERGLQAGADAYLTKGAFDQDKLLAALRRLT
jgi:two-component system chemotaxis sensor kinase CheA